MDMTERKELVLKTAKWLENTDLEVKKAGGGGSSCIIDSISKDLLYTLIANDLYIFHGGETKNYDRS